MVTDLGGVIPEIKTNVWPAFPTDLMSIAITVATQAAGSVLFHDWMYSGRMYFTDKLVGMGARIILCDPYRCLVQGPSQLYWGESGKPGYPRWHVAAAGRARRARQLPPSAISVRSIAATNGWMKNYGRLGAKIDRVAE